MNDGSYYQGTFENNWFYGQGRIIYANGDYYEGTFVRGKRHGEGDLVRVI